MSSWMKEILKRTATTLGCEIAKVAGQQIVKAATEIQTGPLSGNKQSAHTTK